MENFKLVDLFAGTGAFSHAFSKYGVECVFANDMCAYSKKIYDLNHTNKMTCEDLQKIKTEDIPNHDILCAGFPCQPFSIAGKRLGFDDIRSNVFWKIMDIVKLRQPEILILENVKNLQSHDKGTTFKVIMKALENLNYNVKYSVLNTHKLTGIPQNRERIYIVCFKNKTDFAKLNMNFQNVKLHKIKSILEKNVADNYYYSDRYKVWDTVNQSVTKNINTNTLYQYRRYYVRENKNSLCPTLTANMGTGGHNVPLLKDNKGIRKLTPRECFNLQGFPSTYKLPKISDSKLYKLAGNAVSYPIIDLLVKKINDIYLLTNMNNALTELVSKFKSKSKSK